MTCCLQKARKGYGLWNIKCVAISLLFFQTLFYCLKEFMYGFFLVYIINVQTEIGDYLLSTSHMFYDIEDSVLRLITFVCLIRVLLNQGICTPNFICVNGGCYWQRKKHVLFASTCCHICKGSVILLSLRKPFIINSSESHLIPSSYLHYIYFWHIMTYIISKRKLENIYR